MLSAIDSRRVSCGKFAVASWVRVEQKDYRKENSIVLGFVSERAPGRSGISGADRIQFRPEKENTDCYVRTRPKSDRKLKGRFGSACFVERKVHTGSDPKEGKKFQGNIQFRFLRRKEEIRI